VTTLEQIPECLILELIWLPRARRKGNTGRSWGRADSVHKARFEVVLAWPRSRTSVRVDAVWLLDEQVAQMTPAERMDIRDLLDAELQERLGVWVRPWNSDVIEEPRG